MSTQELTTIARDIKELRLMAEQLDAEIATLEKAMLKEGAVYSCTRLRQRYENIFGITL